jgi:23S rRNA (uracil1939-C5)-methyltransferase
VIEVWQCVLRAAELLPDASELRAGVRTTADGYALVVEGGHRWPHASRFADAVPALTEIWWQPRARSAPERVDVQKVESRQRRRPHRPQGAGDAAGRGDASVAVEGQPVMSQADAWREHATGASFVQVNLEMAAALHADVVARALAYAPATVADAYAGTGATAIPLAQRGVHVTAVEADPDAAAHCASTMPAGCQAITARVEDVLPVLLAADVVILNPPRQGVASSVTSALAGPPPARARPRAIIYVSCDPATLARDVARLSGWRVVAVTSFDMFPQTAHVETVCELVRDAEARA